MDIFWNHTLRNIFSFKLNFCVEIYSCVCVTLEYEKENSEYNLSFNLATSTFALIPIWVSSRTRPDYIYLRANPKKHAFQLRYITKFFVPYQAEWTDDILLAIDPVFEILLYRTMLTILLSALIIINLLNWIPV